MGGPSWKTFDCLQKDEPEDVFTGLEMAMGVDWQSRVRAIVHIGDAPAHGRAFHDFKDSRSAFEHGLQPNAWPGCCMCCTALHAFVALPDNVAVCFSSC